MSFPFVICSLKKICPATKESNGESDSETVIIMVIGRNLNIYMFTETTRKNRLYPQITSGFKYCPKNLG